MAMKDWTDAQEAEYQTLTASKQAAVEQSRADIKLLVSTTAASDHSFDTIIAAFLDVNAQAVLDTLSAHYTPTPTTT